MSTVSILFWQEPGATLRQELEQLGVTVVTTSESERVQDVDLVLIEPKRLGAPVAALRQRVEHTHPGVPVVVLGDAGLESAIAAMRAGAAEYLETTASAAEIAGAARRVASERAIANTLSGVAQFHAQEPELLGNSPKLRALRKRIAELAPSDAVVSISGESGSGKTFVARLLHGQHNRGPFVLVDCSTMFAAAEQPEQFTRVLSDIVAAWTPEPRPRAGAHRASFCFREAGSLPLDAQTKLLRVFPPRSAAETGAGPRLLATSSVPLGDLLQAGKLREELHRVLAVSELVVPPLREREYDVLALAELFLGSASMRLGKSVRSLSTAAAKALLSHGWSDNVRELEQVIDYAVTVAAFDHLSDSDLPDALQSRRATSEPKAGDPRWSAVERQHIEAVLRSVAGNRARAARLLGIDRRTLHRKLDRLGIEIPARAQPVISK